MHSCLSSADAAIRAGEFPAVGTPAGTLAEFEKDLKGNLYKIWNRMSSGSYFPPPVKAVEIPKPHGSGTRMLGVPTSPANCAVAQAE